MYRVKRDRLLANVGNWNRLAVLPDLELLDSVHRSLESGELPYVGTRVPLTWLNELASSIGVDRHQLADHFKPVKTATPYPIVHSGEEELGGVVLCDNLRVKGYEIPVKKVLAKLSLKQYH